MRLHQLGRRTFPSARGIGRHHHIAGAYRLRYALEADKPDHRHRRLLRVRRKWPRNRGTVEQRDELAALHSTTSSAMASTPEGILRPNAFAVFARLRFGPTPAAWLWTFVCRGRPVLRHSLCWGIAVAAPL
jgi:hypothetical protein